MKLSYVGHSTAIPSRRAHGVQIMQACRALAGQGVSVRLILPRGQRVALSDLGNFASVWDFYGIAPAFEIKRLTVPPRIGRRYDIYASLALIHALRRRDRLIYTRCLDIAYRTACLGFPTVFECQTFAGFGGDRYNPLLSPWLRLVNRRPRRVALVCATRVDACEYERHGVPADRLSVASNGVDPRAFDVALSREDLRRALDLPVSARMACYSGELDENKGVLQYLKCAALLPDVTFLTVGGEPEHLARCRAFVAEHRLENVRFAGYVPHFQVPRYLLASDVLVMPQIANPKTDFPRSALKVFDYLASGRPIVCADFPTIREVLHDGNAILVPPTGAESLACGIRHALGHPDAAEALGRRAREDAEHFSWDNRANRILAWVCRLFDLGRPEAARCGTVGTG
jgi:glycosyltransferase involved in cell wall biosynthesis